jgi:diguanylate cyclase (GGDEF)-like protein/PAS domain S-box-containing protein
MDTQAGPVLEAEDKPRVTITLPDDRPPAAARAADPDKYRSLMASSPLPFALLDGRTRLAEANRAFADLLGTTIARLRSMDLQHVTHPADHALVEGVIGGLLDQGHRSSSAYLRLVSHQGETIPVLAHLSAVGEGPETHVLVAAVDQRGQRDRLNSLAYAATHDPLTGLLNRAGLLAQLQGLLSDGRSASLALLDLDRLKPINDIYGHAVGDHLLRQIGTALYAMTSPDGLAARLAGDEFVVIADTDDEVALGTFLADQLEHLEVEVAPGVLITPTASIGTSPVRIGMTPSQVLSLADDSMYVVKRRRQEAMSTPLP